MNVKDLIELKPEDWHNQCSSVLVWNDGWESPKHVNIIGYSAAHKAWIVESSTGVLDYYKHCAFVPLDYDEAIEAEADPSAFIAKYGPLTDLHDVQILVDGIVRTNGYTMAIVSWVHKCRKQLGLPMYSQIVYSLAKKLGIAELNGEPLLATTIDSRTHHIDETENSSRIYSRCTMNELGRWLAAEYGELLMPNGSVIRGNDFIIENGHDGDKVPCDFRIRKFGDSDWKEPTRSMMGII